MDRAIVADYNGTCFEYPTAEPMNREIAEAVLHYAVNGLRRGRLSEAGRLLRLALAKGKIESKLRRYRDGSVGLADVYDIFNRMVVRGAPTQVITNAISQFAIESAGRVDDRVLRPLRQVRSKGARTGMLSVDCVEGILTVLDASDFDAAFGPADIVANRLRSDRGAAIEITLGIYGRKAETMEEEFFRKRRFDPKQTMYLGDSPQDDGPVAGLLPRGHFIVPFYATPEARETLSREYGAFVPSSEMDLYFYLSKK